MAIVTGDRYLEKLFNFVEHHAGPLIDGSLVLKLNPAGLHYVQSRLEALHELENLLSGAPIDYLRAYVSDLGDHRALEQLRRILRLLTSLKVVSVLPSPVRDPTPLSLLPFGRLKVLELRGCDLSTSAARGLLELRYTLEKIICHNSTDALRHVFASRIAEIKDSPQWNRLSFVSCAFNRLVLMDESLQLLPAVETLDLSRNKFAKVDNLWKCTKLKHLDLGFNHLTTAPFNEVSCHIVKLVLRNNALTTLRGLENLKSLEGLDISYNLISNFSELEYLAGLPSLQNLWLEGNPLCCARWYRAQVFSYFAYSDTLKLDDLEISTREFWKRQIIVASRQKRPSSYGFYSPAKDDAKGEGSIIRKRRKVSRLAAIESEEDSTYFSSDQESPSCDNDIQSKEENVLSDDEAEIVDLINRVELMKREDSILWLREFKEWMNHQSENYVDGGTHSRATLCHMKENHLKNKTNQKHHGESSRYALNSFHASGDETSTDGLDSDASLVGVSLPSMVGPRQKYKSSHSREGLTMQGDLRVIGNGTLSPLTTIDDTTESHSSSAYPGSPPHYQVDILHRRHNLVEEILQLSAESYSVASSDSDTSFSEDDMYEYGHLVHEDQSQNEDYMNLSVGHSSSDLFDKKYDQKCGIHHLSDSGRFLFNSYDVQKSLNTNRVDFPTVSSGIEIEQFADKEADWLEKTKSRRKSRRRVISLSENGIDKTWTSERPSIEMDTCEVDEEDEQLKEIVDAGNFHDIVVKTKLQKNAIKTPAVANIGRFSDEFIEKYFNANVADSRVNETCRHYLHCDCVIEPESLYREREVALLLSSANKLYVLLVGVAFDGSGNILSLLGGHRVEDVKEVLVGVGLQVVRVYIERGGTYLFLTRSIEKSRQLLYMLQVFVPCATNDKCVLRSLEKFQVELFQKQICGGSKMSIFQYAMVLFSHKDEEESWLSRSLFVSGAHVFLCIEELKQFAFPSIDASSSPYFSLDWYCCIGDVSELVIDSRESPCVTLTLDHATTRLRFSSKAHEEVARIDKENTASSITWRIKWFSEEGLFNFVALLKAIHSGMKKTSTLRITCVS